MRNRIRGIGQYIVLAFVGLGVVSVNQAQTYKYSTLYSFKNNSTDPTSPESSLIIDSDGNLYGTSNGGGSDQSFCSGGCGTVYKVTKSGVVSVLHYFHAPPDGVHPQTSLVRDSKGNLYGTTAEGGSAGCGTVFRITPSDVETVLHSFNCGSDGFSPFSVVLDSAGNIYGTSQTNDLAGLVFKINTNHVFSVLYNFCSLPGCADGENPFSGLIRDRANNLYGSTFNGGTLDAGTVYKLTTAGVETVLYSFGATGPGDGLKAAYNLKQDAKQNLYGVTVHGGVNDPFGSSPGGALFKEPEAGGTETVLYSFCSLANCEDGHTPIGPVQIDSAGNYYGVAEGGANGFGLVWEVSTGGKETVLFNFAASVVLLSGLIIDADGNLYGTTFDGGKSHQGSVYKLTLQK